MQGIQYDYNQYIYPGIKATVNNGVQQIPTNYSSCPTSEIESGTLSSTALGVGIMGGINSLVYTVKNFPKLFKENGKFFDNFRKHAQELHSGIAKDMGFMGRVNVYRNQKIRKHTLDILSKCQGAEGKSANYVNAANNALKNGNFAKSELAAIKAHQRIPMKTTKGLLGSIKKPFNTINNSSIMKRFYRTGIGRIFARGGGPAFAILDGAIQAFTEVIPTFAQKGIFAGLKQTVKSTVSSLANVAGFIGGEAAGAPIGAAIGSFLGPVGTLIGGFVGGMAGGFFVSDKTGKIAKAITGKSEMEKLSESQV